MVGSASCSNNGDCVEVGTDLFANLRIVSGLATKLGLTTRQDEAAFIVGVAKGVSDLGGKRVRVCLRSGEGDETEFRILATGGNHMDQWTSVSKLKPKRPSGG